MGWLLAIFQKKVLGFPTLAAKMIVVFRGES